MSVDIRELMLTGAHFGHRTRFWNPKMAPYIYGKYHSTHIINLDITVENLNKAAEFLESVASSGGTVLFLCTKDAAADILKQEAKSVSMPYVNRRWLGGILTNFKTTRNSVDTLAKIEGDIENGALKYLTKKEGIKLLLMRDKLERVIGGIRGMNDLPDALFVIDAGWHKGAVCEANKLGIPVVAVVDTNHSPDNIDYVIPGNDDSKQAIKIYAREMAQAVAAGRAKYDAGAAAAAEKSAASKPEVKAEAKKPKMTKVVVAASDRKSDRGGDKVVVEDVKKDVKRPAAAKKIIAAAAAAAASSEAGAAGAADKPPPAAQSGSANTSLAEKVKELREMTGFGIMECKKALVESDGDLSKARAWLKEKSGGKAAGVSGRRSGEGRIAFAEKDGVGALAESRCETDFVARADDMAAFVEALAQGVAGVAEKPADIGALKLSDGKTVEEARRELVMKVGENIAVGQVAALTAGDGGGVAAYVHTNKKIAAMCAYRGDESLAREVCMHIVAMRPARLAAEDGTADESALLTQPFVKDSAKTVGEALSAAETSVTEFKLLVVGGDGFSADAPDAAE